MENTPVANTNEPEIINVTQVDGEAFSMESMCPQCYKNGETRMLLTEIPFFKSVIVTSFFCDHCQCRNSEVQSSGQLADYGSDLKLSVTSKDDL